jgi:hypothetical protein
MKTPLFELENPIKEKKIKPINLNKWIILCQKEEIIQFLVEHIPFSNAPKRIDAGWNKGAYTVKFGMNQVQAAYLEGPYQFKNNLEIFQNELNRIQKYWVSGEIYAGIKSTGYIYTTTAQITFFFDRKHIETYEAEWKAAFCNT